MKSIESILFFERPLSSLAFTAPIALWPTVIWAANRASAAHLGLVCRRYKASSRALIADWQKIRTLRQLMIAYL
jgi:hypothetical protein